MSRPSFSGVITGPTAAVSDIRVATCMMTPYRGVKCRRIDMTHTDARGRFSFGSASSFYLPNDLPCGERPLNLIVVCHPDAERLQVVLQPDSPSSIPLQVYTSSFSMFDGFPIRAHVSPEAICAGQLQNPEPEKR